MLIKFLANENVKAIEILRKLYAQFEKKTLSKTQVRIRYLLFIRTLPTTTTTQRTAASSQLCKA